MTFKNKHYIFGGKAGSKYNRQVAQVMGLRLQAIKVMGFDFVSGACANVNDTYIFLCFHSPREDKYNERKRCRAAFKPNGMFRLLTSRTAHYHEAIGIAASKCEYARFIELAVNTEVGKMIALLISKIK